MRICYAIFCRHFASVMLHFASLISHNLRCIPAYTHQIPTGFIQSSLNNHRGNLYIIYVSNALKQLLIVSKHAEGMSLRYGVIVWARLFHLKML